MIEISQKNHSAGTNRDEVVKGSTSTSSVLLVDAKWVRQVLMEQIKQVCGVYDAHFWELSNWYEGSAGELPKAISLICSGRHSCECLIKEIYHLEIFSKQL